MCVCCMCLCLSITTCLLRMPNALVSADFTVLVNPALLVKLPALPQVLADKTVVLATNQLQFVSMADLVVVMRNGSAVETGSYAELLAAGGVFAALMKEAQVRCG